MSDAIIQKFFDHLFAAMKILAEEAEYFNEAINQLPETQEAIDGLALYSISQTVSSIQTKRATQLLTDNYEIAKAIIRSVSKDNSITDEFLGIIPEHLKTSFEAWRSFEEGWPSEVAQYSANTDDENLDVSDKVTALTRELWMIASIHVPGVMLLLLEDEPQISPDLRDALEKVPEKILSPF